MEEKKEESDKNLYEGQASSRYDFLKRKNNQEQKNSSADTVIKSRISNFCFILLKNVVI
jgi:hypothetical protein